MSPADPSPGPATRRRLAEQLRALRVAAGLSTTQLAHQLGWSQPKVSRIETATHGVAPGDVHTWAEALGTSAEQVEQVEQLVELAWTASIEVPRRTHRICLRFPRLAVTHHPPPRPTG